MRIADISTDGSALVGWLSSGVDAFIWTQQGTTVLGPPMGDGTRFTDPYRFSADGNAVVGRGSEGALGVAILWTKENSKTLLGHLPDGGSAAPADVSADASVIVSGRWSGRIFDAWIWRESRTIELLHDVLTNEYGLGPQVASWNLQTATAMSNDGRTIVGFGTNPNGQTEGWVAFLGTPVPEPSTLFLTTLALPFACRRRRSPKLRAEHACPLWQD